MWWNRGSRAAAARLSKMTSSSFWKTTSPSGLGQHMGMAALGGVAGGASAYMTGGSVMQGAAFGAGLGVTASAYNTQLWGAAREARLAWGMRGQSPTSRMQAGMQRMEAAKAMGGSITNAGRASATAAGIGLASGVMFSGHRRKNVNRFNSSRGNYIGR